jgi:hypothetical protein
MNSPDIKSIIASVKSAPEIPEPQKIDLINKLEAVPSPLQTDPWIYRFVVLFLGSAVIITVAGGIFLTYTGGTSQNFQMPQGIVAIGSAAVGALAGLLAPSPKQA